MEEVILDDAFKQTEGAEKLFGSGDKAEFETQMNDFGNGCEKTYEEKGNTNGGYNKEKPPEDDCCPICFGDFKVPCKANCGHWFCGSCILQLWKYRSRPQQCKCPLCSSSICRLTPEVTTADKTEDGVIKVHDDIEKYNSFYVKGGVKRYFMLLTFYIVKHGPLMTEHLGNLVVNILVATALFVGWFMSNVIKLTGNYNTYRLRRIVAILSVILRFYLGILTEGYQRSQGVKITWWLDLACISLFNIPYAVLYGLVNTLKLWLRFETWLSGMEVDAEGVRTAEQELDVESLPMLMLGPIIILIDISLFVGRIIVDLIRRPFERDTSHLRAIHVILSVILRLYEGIPTEGYQRSHIARITWWLDVAFIAVYHIPNIVQRCTVKTHGLWLRFQMWRLTREREALTRERDALTREMDALTKERDALTRKRDALRRENDALRAWFSENSKQES